MMINNGPRCDRMHVGPGKGAMTKYLNRFLTLGLLILSLCAGKCNDSEDDGSNVKGTAATLADRAFISTTVKENGETRALVTGTGVSLRFYEDGRLMASAGCNSISGNYEVVDGALKMTMLGMTEMGCDQERYAQDEWLSAVLAANPAIVLDGDELTLDATLDNGTHVQIGLLDAEVAIPDRKLVGTPWFVDTLIDGAAATNGTWDSPAQLEFQQDGKVHVFDGCNSATGTYTVSGDKIEFGDDFETTLVSCDGDEAVAKLENHVWSVISGQVTFSIDQNRLLVMADGAGLGCTAGGVL